MNLFGSELYIIIYAFLGGFIPALVWLYFWDQEDKKNPEPKRIILLAFLGGVVAVFASLYLEKLIYQNGPEILSHFKSLYDWIYKISRDNNVLLEKLTLVVVFAPIIEELAKFIIAYVFVLRSKYDDQPIDPMILMITTALGFAALENTLFLIDPLTKKDFVFTILTGNMRFIGATLLHTISSATIGMFISFNFFDKKLHKFFWTILGIIMAIIVHAFFNFFMIVNTGTSFVALEVIWVLVIIVLLAFERIKRVHLEKIQ